MSADWQRPFGATGLVVTAVGFGAGHIGGDDLTDAEAGRLLNGVVDLGIRLIDTARGYGRSEERIGRHLAGRRGEIVLSTKIGYGIPGCADWTPAVIGAGVREALQRLRTDHLDIVHLHSCPRRTLEEGGVLEALQEEVQAGRVRVAAYSGDNDALAVAAVSGLVGSLQTSISVVDQWALREVVPTARDRQLGVIAKRPLANAPWRFRDRPEGHYGEAYWERWRQLGLDRLGMDPNELAVRFVAHAPGVHACIVGSRNLQHVAHNVALAQRGPIEDALRRQLAITYDRVGADWPGLT
jgi:aryl-alcohol dehydrogenase-like predicted oxidoreductase